MFYWFLPIILAAANAPITDISRGTGIPPGSGLLSVSFVRNDQKMLQWKKWWIGYSNLIVVFVVVLPWFIRSVNVKNGLFELLVNKCRTQKCSANEDYCRMQTLDLYRESLYAEGSSKRALPWYLQSVRKVPQQLAWTLPLSLDRYFQQTSQPSASSDDHRMKNEWFRYATFNSFPMESPVMPIRLAQTGFYYSGREDEVTCFSCKVTYSRWGEGDIPSEVHRRLSPACEFLSGCSHSNEPIHEETGAQSSAQTMATHATDAPSAENEHEMDSVDHDPVVMETAVHQQTTLSTTRTVSRHPMYESEATRMQTFDHWPCPEVQDPGLLAEAGFFYAGSGDCVRCYSCGGGLRNWQYGDGAWEEHARWFPRCYFLNQTQSQEFIRRHHEGNGDHGDGMELPDNTPPSPVDAWHATDNTVMTDTTGTPSARYETSNHNRPATKLPPHQQKQVNEPPRRGAKVLREENEKLKQQLICKICLDAYVCTILLPCNHLVACAPCASKIQNCAVCRAVVKGRIRAFLS